MTTLADEPSAADDPTAVATTSPHILQRADGIELLGAAPGSGYRTPPALVQRSDGQILQLTPLLYATLDAIDGMRDDDAIAAQVRDAVQRAVTADDVRALVDKQLRPLGLLCLADGSQPQLRKANPLLALKFRYVVSDPQRTRRLTAPFARLFNPIVVVLATLAFAAVAYWVLFDKGLASAAHEAFTDPGMLLAVFALTLVSAGFHEFGHAAALRRGGGTPGAMGAGIYLVWPAFYTDVTDSYRLSRGARLRTDFGGLYFNALVALATFGVWSWVRWDGLLLLIATQILQMLRQLPPMLRFDGYHMLADLTGVPDLFHRIKPTLVALWPTHWRSPEARELKPWTRAVVTLWVLLVVPLMLLTALITLVTLPRIMASAGHSFATQWSLLVDRWQHDAWLGVGAKMLALVAVAIPVFGVSFMVVRTVRQLAVSTLRRTNGKPLQRAVSSVVAALLVVALGWAWWPRGNYRPIQANEVGTVQQIAAPVGQTITRQPASAGQQILHTGQTVSARTIWPGSTPLPKPGHPQLAMVLVPRSPGGQTWVFPFDRPAAPTAGGNQAMAIATKDGSTVYSVAFALVTTGNDTVLNRNEAYAYADCRGCRALAIAFQVVLIVGDAHVAAPQNLSAAVGYNCIQCVTQALAVQLVVSLPGSPDASTAAKLAALWERIRAFSTNLHGLTLAQIAAQLTDYQKQIVQVLAAAPASSPSASSSGSAGASGSPSASGSPGAVTPGATDTPGSFVASPSASPQESGPSAPAGSPAPSASTTGASPVAGSSGP